MPKPSPASPLVAQKMAGGDLSVDNVRLLGAVVGEQAFDGDAELLVEIASGSPRDTSGMLAMEATARTYRYLDSSELEEIRKNAAKAKPGAKK